MSKDYGHRLRRREYEQSKQYEYKEKQSIDELEGQLQKEVEGGKISPKKSIFPYFVMLVMGGILSLTFYTFPLIGQLATSFQSQQLYSGLAMSKGLIPFNDFFGTGGALFYLINWLGNLGNSSLLLYLFSLIALVAGGFLTYRLMIMQIKQAVMSLNLSLFVMIIVAGLSHGGNTPTLFAFPFTVLAVTILEIYFHKDMKDEMFIIFGMLAAIVFFISPIMLLFFVFSGLALLVYNLVSRRFGRAFYQILASLFGFLVIGYGVAYYSLNEQILFTSIQQSILLPITHLALPNDWTFIIAKSVMLLIIFGLFIGFMQGFKELQNENGARIWYFFLLVGGGVSLLFNLFNPNFDSSGFILLLTFGLVFIAKRFANLEYQSAKDFSKFMRGTFLTPILSLIFVFALPFVYSYINHDIFSSEKEVAQYIKKNSGKKDRVYVLSTDKNINLLAERVASFDTPPKYYPLEFHQNFDLKAAAIKDKFVVIENGQAIPESLNQALKRNYKEIDLKNNSFKVYQSKKS